MERTTMYLHFQPDEELPQVGHTIQVDSALTRTTYRVTILKIESTKTLSDGRIQMKVRADREEIS